MGKIFWEIYQSIRRQRTPDRGDCRGGGGEGVLFLGTGVFGPFSLAGNRVAALHLAIRFFWREIILNFMFTSTLWLEPQSPAGWLA